MLYRKLTDCGAWLLIRAMVWFLPVNVLRKWHLRGEREEYRTFHTRYRCEKHSSVRWINVGCEDCYQMAEFRGTLRWEAADLAKELV